MAFKSPFQPKLFVILCLCLLSLSHSPEDISPPLVKWEPRHGPKPDLHSGLHCYKWCSKITYQPKMAWVWVAKCWFAYFSVWMPPVPQTLKFQVQKSINTGLTCCIFIKTLPSAAFLRDALCVPLRGSSCQAAPPKSLLCLWKHREDRQVEKFLTFFKQLSQVKWSEEEEPCLTEGRLCLCVAGPYCSEGKQEVECKT